MNKNIWTTVQKTRNKNDNKLMERLSKLRKKWTSKTCEDLFSSVELCKCYQQLKCYQICNESYLNIRTDKNISEEKQFKRHAYYFYFELRKVNIIEMGTISAASFDSWHCISVVIFW